MKKNIPVYINQFLIHQPKVFVTGLGTFYKHWQSATWSQDGPTISGPGYLSSFEGVNKEAEMGGEDELFESFVAYYSGRSLDGSRLMIKQFVDQVNDHLARQGKLIIPHFGKFEKVKGRMFFEAFDFEKWMGVPLLGDEIFFPIEKDGEEWASNETASTDKETPATKFGASITVEDKPVTEEETDATEKVVMPTTGKETDATLEEKVVTNTGRTPATEIATAFTEEDKPTTDKNNPATEVETDATETDATETAATETVVMPSTGKATALTEEGKPVTEEETDATQTAATNMGRTHATEKAMTTTRNDSNSSTQTQTDPSVPVRHAALSTGVTATMYPPKSTFRKNYNNRWLGRILGMMFGFVLLALLLSTFFLLPRMQSMLGGAEGLNDRLEKSSTVIDEAASNDKADLGNATAKNTPITIVKPEAPNTNDAIENEDINGETSLNEDLKNDKTEAQKLGSITKDEDDIEIKESETIETDKTSPKTKIKPKTTPKVINSNSTNKCMIIVGAFSEDANAEAMKRRIEALGLTPYQLNRVGLTHIGVKEDCRTASLRSALSTLRKQVTGDAWVMRLQSEKN